MRQRELKIQSIEWRSSVLESYDRKECLQLFRKFLEHGERSFVTCQMRCLLSKTGTGTDQQSSRPGRREHRNFARDLGCPHSSRCLCKCCRKYQQLSTYEVVRMTPESRCRSKRNQWRERYSGCSCSRATGFHLRLLCRRGSVLRWNQDAYSVLITSRSS